jgi:hypothetical protein
MRKFTPAFLLALALSMLAACMHEMTLEEAKADCDKKGGQLTIFYSQKITISGVGPIIQTPGECITADKFLLPPKSEPGAPPAPSAAGH